LTHLGSVVLLNWLEGMNMHLQLSWESEKGLGEDLFA